jgi:hypothetical protein
MGPISAVAIAAIVAFYIRHIHRGARALLCGR